MHAHEGLRGQASSSKVPSAIMPMSNWIGPSKSFMPTKTNQGISTNSKHEGPQENDLVSLGDILDVCNHTRERNDQPYLSRINDLQKLKQRQSIFFPKSSNIEYNLEKQTSISISSPPFEKNV